MSTPSLTTSSLTATATSTAPLALTTPYVQPPECSSIWDVTSGSTWLSTSRSTVTILVSDPVDRRFSSCQPSGWDSSSFSFSAAVCPSDWTYYSMAATTEASRGNGETYTSAFCCASGYSLDLRGTFFSVESITQPCYRKVDAGGTTVTGTLSHGEGSTLLFTYGIQMHEAWQITWAASDTSTLSPPPPEISMGGVASMWVPGEPLPALTPTGIYLPSSTQTDTHGTSDRDIWAPLMRFLMIGLPIILVAIIGGCVTCIVRGNSRERRIRLRKLENAIRETEAMEFNTVPPAGDVNDVPTVKDVNDVSAAGDKDKGED